jgi:uncharacterized protein with beta-barrel porin domain
VTIFPGSRRFPSRLLRHCRIPALAACALVAVLPMTSTAMAACAPPAVNAASPAPGTTVTCRGATTDQNGTDGYGTGNQTGITINVNTGATVTGSGANGIFVGDATVNNLGSISASGDAITTLIGSITVTNSGSIQATGHDGILAQGGATVINNATGIITGGTAAVAGRTSVNVTNFGNIAGDNTGVATQGIATVVNYGSITGGNNEAIIGNNGVVVTNNAGASISSSVGIGIEAFTGVSSVVNAGSIVGATNGINANSGSITITNSGSISATNYGVVANAGVTVTNGIGGSITASGDAITTLIGSLTVTNSGSIQAIGHDGILAQGSATVINNATGIITGGTAAVAGRTSVNVTNYGNIAGDNTGVATQGIATVANYGSVSGGNNEAIIGNNGVMVTNNAGASIISGVGIGIEALTGGGSSIFNAGSITGATAAIQFAGSGNTLTLAPGSVISGNVLGTGSDTLQLGGTGAATFDVSALGPAAQYQGFGTFNKIGSSVWALTGTSTFAGDVNVNGGTLVVNGNLAAAGIMTVNSGGTLSGTGTVPFTLLADGATLAPGPQGSGTGTLTVNDRLMFCNCSTYAVKISGAGNDLAQVVAGGFGSGDAFLAGLVRVSLPTSNFRFNSAYTILTTQGGLNGTTFDSLQTPGGIGGVLSYTADNVLLTLSSQLAQLTGLNANQRAVATALDTAFNVPGGQTGAFSPIYAGNIPQNLTQASGETATGSQQTTFQAMNQFMGVMTDPFNAGRSDGPGTMAAIPFAGQSDDATAYASNDKPRSERDAYAAIYRKAPVRSPVYDPRWSVWAAGFGGSQTTNGNGALGSNDTTSRMFGMAAGADYLLSPRTIAGFALAGGATSFSVANGGSGRSDLFQAGAFIKHKAGAAYASAALAYGWQDITTDRTVTIAGVDRLRAQFNANAFSGRIEGGYRFVTPWMNGFGFTPYAAAQFTSFDLPGYAEQVLSGANTFALNYGSKSVTASRSEFGVRSDKSYAVGNAVLTLRGRAAWAHDYNTDRNVSATFQSLPVANFVVNGAAPARDAALTSASAEMKFISGLSLAAAFEGEFSGITYSYAGKGVMRYQW